MCPGAHLQSGHAGLLVDQREQAVVGVLAAGQLHRAGHLAALRRHHRALPALLGRLAITLNPVRTAAPSATSPPCAAAATPSPRGTARSWAAWPGPYPCQA